MLHRRHSCARTLALVPLLAALAPAVASAAPEGLGAATRLEEVGAGSFLVRSGDALYAAPLLETEVEIAVTGIVARARVTQRFTNPTDDWVEGVYVFPLPEDAAVDALHMRAGEREIEGVIQERTQARRTYAQAKASGRRASLVEQERPNVFTTSVANLGPRETLEVRIAYQEEVDYAAGVFSLRFPTVVAPRFVPGGTRLARVAEPHRVAAFAGTGWARATAAVPDAARITPPVRPPGDPVTNPCVIDVRIDAGLPLARVESPSHAIESDYGPAGDTRVRLARGAVPADADFVLEWEPEVGTAPAAALFSEEFEGDHYALLMLMPPAEGALPVSALPREAIFVIDVSGSMHGASIDQARAALALAIRRLGSRDRFNVIRFASSAEALFPAPVPATHGARARALDWVARLHADGGTQMQGALELALADAGGSEAHLRQVVFITDGAVGNERALFDVVRRRLGRSRLFTVGIGSAPNAFLMRKLARFGRGTTTWIGSPAEVGSRMAALFEKLERPALGGIEVHFPSSGVEAWPERVPDLYASEPVVLVARVPRLGGSLRVEGARGGVPFRVDLPFSGGGPQSGVHKLWARRKVAALMDSVHEGADAAKVREEMVALGLHHGLVTRHTSLVAVERLPVAPRGAQLHTRNVPGQLPRGWSHRHVPGPGGAESADGAVELRIATSQGPFGMPQTATPAGLWMALGLVVLALGLALHLLGLRARHTA